MVKKLELKRLSERAKQQVSEWKKSTPLPLIYFLLEESAHKIKKEHYKDLLKGFEKFPHERVTSNVRLNILLDGLVGVHEIIAVVYSRKEQNDMEKQKKEPVPPRYLHGEKIKINHKDHKQIVCIQAACDKKWLQKDINHFINNKNFEIIKFPVVTDFSYQRYVVKKLTFDINVKGKKPFVVDFYIGYIKD